MLVLTRREGEQVVIGEDIIVTICEVRGGKVRIGFQAPPEVKIYRIELLDDPEGEQS